MTTACHSVLEKLKDAGLRFKLQNLWTIISNLSTKYRKRLVLLCRAQEVILHDPFNLLAIQTGFGSVPDQYDTDCDYQEFLKLVTDHQSWIRSPIFSSIMLDMCRSTPLRVSEVKDQKLASWGKEIAICESGEGFLHLDYTCWFDPTECHRPIMAGVPPNPAMAFRIYQSLVEWKQRLSGKLLYPRMSRKQVSMTTVREWERFTGREWVLEEASGGVEMTQETLERVYHENDVELEGACEIRQKWYKSGVVPRTYFAQGGTAYRLSKYVQEIGSLLVETLETTHPISRLNPARIRLKSPAHYLRIYDLKTFTSNHWECKHFVARLGEWCLGTMVNIVDAVEGVKLVDLGELILEYNSAMNNTPEYSMERIDSEFFERPAYHHRAGFLGVYGNINFSTYLHGASLLMIVQNMNEANVAGDDAHYSEEHGMEDVSDRVIEANGLLEPTKVFASDQIGAVCLKRGVVQIEDRVLPKLMLIFPSFSNIGEVFGYFPPQFPTTQTTKKERKSKVGTEIYRFFRALSVSNITQDLDSVHDLLNAVYDSVGLPKYGSLPPYGETLVPVLPDDPITLTEISPLELLLRNHFSGGAILPRVLDIGDIDESRDPVLIPGYSWSGSATRKLKYLEVLGYVVKEEQSEALWGLPAYNRIIDVFSGIGIKIYTYTCIADVPDHLLALPHI